MERLPLCSLAAIALLGLTGCSKAPACDEARRVVTYNPSAAGNEIYREPPTRTVNDGCEPWP